MKHPEPGISVEMVRYDMTYFFRAGREWSIDLKTSHDFLSTQLTLVQAYEATQKSKYEGLYCCKVTGKELKHMYYWKKGTREGDK